MPMFSKSGKYVKDLSLVGNSGEGTSYDFVIVGGARLTEDPSISVLLLEAGGSGSALSESRIPAAFTQLRGTPHLFNFTLEPQLHATSRPRHFPRGRVLGGCSSVNAQMAQYGAPGDFDQWASPRSLLKFEKYTGDAVYPDVDMSARGSAGPVRVGYFNRVSEHSKGFVEACREVGIPFIADFNDPKGPIGASRVVTYVDPKGQRVSSKTAYLTKDVLARPNLKVAIHAQVTLERANGPPRAIGVEFAGSPGGPRLKALVHKEVILSAGAIHSPHILMLSGLGPATQLRKQGISIVRDMPAVGANLVDHPLVSLYLRDKKNDSTNLLKPKTVLEGLQLAKKLAQYQLFGTGKLATNDHGQVVFNVHTYGLHCYLLRPTSRGSIGLASPDPWALPTVDPNYLHARHDLEKLLRGFRLITRIARANAMDAYINSADTNPELDHSMHLKTDDELREVIRERVETVYYPTSTCRMAQEVEGGVVDSSLRVYGAGACFAIAEKFADGLKVEYQALKL
ncbi:GMC oxidoreductase-domain-containing protein [Favolaschia claudopus]|uniref:GMC oxidoreductase-domain-containing protein n=1 Tax=Favolaschia claudopus TaxID=2862362 RepID=A0AAV9ZGF5_9AGAR